MASGVVRRAALAAAGLVATAVGVFVVLAPPEHCPTTSTAQLQASATEAADWFVRNQQDDGRWLYLYDAETDTAADDYNAIRHAGAMMGLYQAAVAGVPGAQESADRGLAWVEDNLIERGDWSAISHNGDVATGATALLVAGLVDRRRLTGDGAYDDLLQEAGRFLVAQTEPSGAVTARYSIAEGGPVRGVYSKYYTGETYWALARLHQVFPSGPWGETADRIGAYLATRRDADEGYWPPLPDHWSAYGLADTVGRQLTDDEVAYARRQAGLFGAQVRWVSQHAGSWGPLVRGPQELRGGGYGVNGEALGQLWQVAQREPRLASVRATLGDRARCIAGLTADAQSDADEAAGKRAPDKVRGAWFRDGETRMDDQQHAMSALLAAIPIAEAGADGSGGGGDGGGSGRPAPSPWLWLVALVAAFDPVRVAQGLPRADRSRRTVTAVAALGGLIGSVVVATLALAGDWLVEVLDVSTPALRVAAGTVAAITGAVGMVRRAPDPAAPALPGLRAAWVPVAVPLVVGPALVLLAVSAHADRGLAVVVGALVVGVAALTALAAGVPDDGPAVRSLPWATRASAAVLLAVSILLLINGVLDV
jgi:small neutral amino acid transporter SnatA (MarC family)